MDFSNALQHLKGGLPVARSGWNGKDMFVYRVPEASYPARTDVAKRHFGADALVPYRAYYALKGADGMIATWVPSSTDLDADDWYVVERMVAVPAAMAAPYGQQPQPAIRPLSSEADDAFLDD